MVMNLPKLFDLTGLQVYCNTKFGFSADETLKIVQTLYEQKSGLILELILLFPMIFIPKFKVFTNPTNCSNAAFIGKR
jgi:hypothetical protein